MGTNDWSGIDLMIFCLYTYLRSNDKRRGQVMRVLHRVYGKRGDEGNEAEAQVQGKSGHSKGQESHVLPQKLFIRP